MKLEERINTLESTNLQGLLRKIKNNVCLYTYFIDYNLPYKEAKRTFKQRLITWLGQHKREGTLQISKKSVQRHNDAHIILPYEGLLSDTQTQKIVEILVQQASAKPLKEHMKTFETLYLSYHMKQNKGHATVTAQKIGLTRETLSRKWNIIRKTKTL